MNCPFLHEKNQQIAVHKKCTFKKCVPWNAKAWLYINHEGKIECEKLQK